MTWHLWAKYHSHHQAWRNKAFQEEDTDKQWRVIRDKTRIRGWLLQYRTDWGNDEHRT